MQKEETAAEFFRRAREVRRIAARGIFDPAERDAIERFVAEAERLAAARMAAARREATG